MNICTSTHESQSMWKQYDSYYKHCNSNTIGKCVVESQGTNAQCNLDHSTERHKQKVQKTNAQTTTECQVKKIIKNKEKTAIIRMASEEQQ